MNSDLFISSSITASIMFLYWDSEIRIVTDFLFIFHLLSDVLVLLVTFFTTFHTRLSPVEDLVV
jgi:uncharacterized membrane protein